MTDMIDTKPDLGTSISELESLGLKTKLNQLNDSYEIGNLVKTLKQMLFLVTYTLTCLRAEKQKKEKRN